MASSGPLEGVVVVELGTSVAAPFAGLILAYIVQHVLGLPRSY